MHFIQTIHARQVAERMIDIRKVDRNEGSSICCSGMEYKWHKYRIGK